MHLQSDPSTIYRARPPAETGRTSVDRAALEQYLDNAEEDPVAWRRLAELEWRAGRRAEGRRAFEEAARAYDRAGLSLRAVATLKRWLARDPEQAAALELLGRIVTKLGMPVEAREFYRRAVDAYRLAGHWAGDAPSGRCAARAFVDAPVVRARVA